MSSPLFCLSFSVGPWLQCQRLIKAWLWFALNDQGEETGSSVITEHWRCINFNHSTIRGCHAPGASCTLSDQRGIQSHWFLLIMSDILASFMRENTLSDQKCHRLKSADCLKRSELRSWKRHAISFVQCTAALQKAVVGHFKTCVFLFQRSSIFPKCEGGR